MSWLKDLPRRAIILMIRGYQIWISPLLGCNCRFTPSCSQYFVDAVNKHGVWRGSWKGVFRILRCHPFHPGGHDPA